MTRHFAHRDASKCDRETQIHFFVKNELLKQGDKFIIRLDNDIKSFMCKEILIEQQYKTEFGIYNPDITVITEDNKTIYFEVSHTNKKKIEDYLDIWMELNNIVVEVESRDIINGKFLREFNAKFYEEKCFNIKQEDKEYYELIGKIKLNKNKYPIEQVNKLDWLWRDINKYLLGEIEISIISDLIQSIENKELQNIIVTVLRKNRCNRVMDDYIKYNIKTTEESLNSYNKDYKFECKVTRLIYERIFIGCDIDMFYKYIYCGKGFCIYNFDSFDNILECNENKILYGKLKYFILSKLPKCKDVKYLNNSYGESIYFSNTYINLENEKNAYDTVNSLVNEKLEKNKIKIENSNVFEKNKIWLQEIENTTYKYWKNDNSIDIYYECGQRIISFNNKLLSNVEISNIKLDIKRKLDNIKTYEDFKNKLNNIVKKVNDNSFNFKIISKVKIYNDNYEEVQVSIDVNNVYIFKFNLSIIQ
jgi:hypothetical protein